MSTKVLSDFDFNSASRILNLLDAVAPQEPATLAQLQSAIEGLNWKDNVKVATQSNVNLASPGATVDGISMSANDRVLVQAQSTASENGIYIWNGAATPMTRALDMNLSAEFNEAVVVVDQGTSAGVGYRQTAVNPTVGSTSIVFTSFGVVAPPATESTAGIAEIATQGETDTGTDDARIVTPLKLANWASRIKKFSSTFGDGSATQYDITHSLNSVDVEVQVYVVATGAQVLCDITRFSVNVVRLNFAVAPALNTLRCVVVS